jgi:hypothetical protein
MKRVALAEPGSFIQTKEELVALNNLLPEGIPVRAYPLVIERAGFEIDCFEVDCDRLTSEMRVKLAHAYVNCAPKWLLKAVTRNKGIFPIPVRMADTVTASELRLQRLTKKALAHLKLKRRMEVRGLAWSLDLNEKSRELKAVIQRLEEMGVAEFRRDYGYYARYVDLVVLIDGGQAA